MTTLGGFVEATAHQGYRLTLGRALLALVIPLLWIAAIVLPSWDYSLPHLAVKSSWLVEVILGLLVMLVAMIVFFVIVVGGPAFLVMTIVVWVGAAATGGTIELLEEIGQRLFRRKPKDDPNPPDEQYNRPLS